MSYGHKGVSELVHKAAKSRFNVRYGIAKYYARLYCVLRHNYTEVVGFFFKSLYALGARVEQREHFGIAFSEKVGSERVSLGSVLHIREGVCNFVEFFFRREPFQILKSEPEARKRI